MLIFCSLENSWFFFFNVGLFSVFIEFVTILLLFCVLVNQGLNTTPTILEGKVLTTGTPRKSLFYFKTFPLSLCPPVFHKDPLRTTAILSTPHHPNSPQQGWRFFGLSLDLCLYVSVCIGLIYAAETTKFKK